MTGAVGRKYLAFQSIPLWRHKSCLSFSFFFLSLNSTVLKTTLHGAPKARECGAFKFYFKPLHPFLFWRSKSNFNSRSKDGFTYGSHLSVTLGTFSLLFLRNRSRNLKIPLAGELKMLGEISALMRKPAQSNAYVNSTGHVTCPTTEKDPVSASRR